MEDDYEGRVSTCAIKVDLTSRKEEKRVVGSKVWDGK